ncbi:toll/interleukin-1 receptor domain-containing protein [Flavobacterium mesophilum]|uniref:toll/interleukin-1 receptor domain-containing protein n=1 Tax=Flavobacterium mesophilum TaxID=3143495 RepID=UPI0031DCB236
MKIYIDHFPSSDDFVTRLAEQIRKIDKNLSVTTFLDLRTNGHVEEDGEDVRIMNESDIWIPIITSEFISFYPTEIEQKYYEIIESENKIIFPIIYNEVNWSSKKWIVKSRIFPSNGKVFEELNSNEQASVINELVHTIGNIYSESTKEKLNSIKLPTSKIELEDQVFISHSHDDADFAELLKLHLEKNKIACWMDNERLKIGQDWREEIDTGISKSKAIIVIMSPEARKSEYVTYEWAYAWGKGIKIFPIMLKQTSLHPRLESLQYMDFTNRVTRPYDELVKGIRDIKN